MCSHGRCRSWLFFLGLYQVHRQCLAFRHAKHALDQADPNWFDQALGQAGLAPRPQTHENSCSEDAKRQWQDRHFVMLQDKHNGHVYLKCSVGNPKEKFKVSCLHKDCVREDSGAMPQFPELQAQEWCFVQSGCGWATSCRPLPREELPSCPAPLSDFRPPPPPPDSPTKKAQSTPDRKFLEAQPDDTGVPPPPPKLPPLPPPPAHPVVDVPIVNNNSDEVVHSVPDLPTYPQKSTDYINEDKQPATEEIVARLVGKADLRLAGKGATKLAGRLEIFHDGEWGTVCDDGFGLDGAKVACRALGLAGGEEVDIEDYGQGSGMTWLSEVECSGDEDSLALCAGPAWGVHDCSHSEDAAIRCMEPESETEMAAREQKEAEQAALEKAALEEAQNAVLEKAAALEKAALEKAALEKAALEKAALEKAALEKAALEKAALEEAEAEKVEAEKVAAETEALEKAALEKAALEKAALEKAAIEKAALEEAEAEKVEAERVEAEKKALEHAAAEELKKAAAALVNLKAKGKPTCGGTDDRAPCVFPFFDNGVEHNECIPDEYGYTWCATSKTLPTDLEIQNFGYCECEGFYDDEENAQDDTDGGITDWSAILAAAGVGEKPAEEDKKPVSNHVPGSFELSIQVKDFKGQPIEDASVECYHGLDSANTDNLVGRSQPTALNGWTQVTCPEHAIIKATCSKCVNYEHEFSVKDNCSGGKAEGCTYGVALNLKKGWAMLRQ